MLSKVDVLPVRYVVFLALRVTR